MSKLTILAFTFAFLALGYFVLATDAVAYGGDAPETCANCHVMDSQYENWFHGGHANWAKCTDCHLPHENVVVYFAEKGRQGMKDTYAFVTGNIPTVIRASIETKTIVQANCIHCHESAVQNILMADPAQDRYCWECHRNVAHSARGESGLPFQDSTLYPIK